MTIISNTKALTSKSQTHLPVPSDPSSIKLPESPDKRSIRRLQSHNQLSSTSRNFTHRNAPDSKITKENLALNLNPLNVTRSPSRPRANSEAPVPLQPKPSRKNLALAAHTNAHANTVHVRKSSLEVTLKEGPPPGTTPSAGLNLLRHSILTTGVQATKEGMSDYRIYLWLTLLNVPPLATDSYLNQIHRGRSPAWQKIANDVFRTLATDTLFKRRVTDASLTRLLNATAWRITDTHKTVPADSPTIQSPYLQGINVLAAPLLYASRSEAQAYALLTTLLTHHLPTYLTPTMSGVHAAVELIDKILATISPSLSQFLLSNSLPAKIYAFASVLTLCACTPPLPEVLKLWDFLFAFGVHLNVLCIVAQLLLIKDQLMASPSPAKTLRNLPNLNADSVIKMTLVIVRELPEDIYAEIVRHGRF